MLDGLGARQPVPAPLRVAARGWVAFAEEATVDWLASGDLDRAELIRLLDDSLVALMTVATRS